MEKKIVYSNTEDKIVDLEEYKKSPLHQQRLEEHAGKPKSRKEAPKKKSKQVPGKNPVNKGEKMIPGFKQKTAKPVRGKEYNMVAFFVILAVLAALCLAIAFFIQNSQPVQETTASALQYLFNIAATLITSGG
ncbi:MAG: hypothetical protein H6Q58_1618 [Firmicutes bacterium]|nr:hypothetical protein [Bacillota bacterium]